MKKILLAPAVAVVAGSVAFAGSAAVASPATTNPGDATASATDEPEAPKPELSAPNDGKDSRQFRKEGQTIEYKNLEAGKDYTWSFIGADGVQSSGKFTANEANGSFDAVVTNDTDDMFLPGKYTVTVKDENGETVGKTSFKVERHNEDPGDGGNPDAPKPEATVEHDKIRATPFRDNGLTVEYKNLEPGKNYTWVIEGGKGIEIARPFTAKEANGSFDVTVSSDTAVEALLGEYTVKLFDGEGNVINTNTSFTVVKDSEDSGNPDEDETRYKLTLDRHELTAKEFLDKESGVQIGVIGLKSNEKFTYSVTKVDGEGKVEDYENEATADKEGRWGTTLNGVQRGQSIESFVGKYKVTVKSEQGELTDHFTVTNGKKSDNDDDAEAGDNGSGSGSDNGSGSGNDSSAGNSSDLPRTGAGLTGLLAGGALLTVGAATVLITRRRAK